MVPVPQTYLPCAASASNGSHKALIPNIFRRFA
jgi:hypothetical protein